MPSTRTILIIVILATFGGLLLLAQPYIIDDSYISYVYAKNAAQGNGLTYNGLWVEGFSNPSWVVAHVPALALGLDPLLTSRLLSVGASLITLGLLSRLITRLTAVDSPLFNGLMVLILASNGAFIAWNMAGLETAFLALLITAIVVAETDATDHPVASGLLVALAALTRPEAIMLAIIVLIYRIIRREPLIVWLAAALLPVGVYFAWRMATYGYPLPNTAYAKLGPETTLTNALIYLGLFTAIHLLIVLPLLVGVGRIVKARPFDQRWLLVGAIIAAYVFFVLASGGDWMPFWRFLVPVMPLVVLTAAKGMAGRWSDARGKQMVSGLAGLIVAFAISTQVIWYRPIYKGFTLSEISLTEYAAAIDAYTEPDDVIAVVDAGMLAYTTEQPTIDILGLNNAHIAHAPGNRDPAYVLSFEPVFIQLHYDEDDDGNPDHSMVGYAPFTERYHRLAPGDLPIDIDFGNLFIRRDVLDALQN